MNRILFGFLTLATYFCCINTSYGQKSVEKTNEWTNYYSDEKIELNTKYGECEIPNEGLYAEQVYLQIKNKTNVPIQVSWYNRTYYNGICSNCDQTGGDSQNSIIINSNSVKQGQCQIGVNFGLRIHSKWLRLDGKRSLTGLQITDIKTKPVEQK